MFGHARRATISWTAAAVLLVALSARPVLSAACDGCKRRAVVTKATSNDPFFSANGGKTLLSSTRGHLAELLTSPYFHLLNKEFVDSYVQQHGTEGGRALSDYHPPEYLFKVDFRVGLNEPREGQKPIVSRLEISLYYDGDSEEHVQTWRTESTIDDYMSHVNRMYENRTAVMRKAKPIENLLWDFERSPVSCKIDMHGVESVKPGEEIEIELKDFKDAKGRKSKPFNRIVLQAKEGKILNGTALEADKDLKAFRIGSGSVTVKYKAPEEPGISEDTVWVNHSCEILPESKYPMSKTDFAGDIAEQKIPIAGMLTARIVETSSGSATEEYPFSYTVSMDFSGPAEGIQVGEALRGTEGGDQLRELLQQGMMPPEIRKLSGGKDAKFVAKLLPVESSMKVQSWHCTDPMNNAPPAPRFPRGVAVSHIPGSGAQVWIIGDKAYIVQGFLDGILGYFASWEDDDELSSTQEQPLGARVGGTWGDMGEYLEIPLDKLKKGQSLTIKKAHSGTDGDAWRWTTNWTITLVY